MDLGLKGRVAIVTGSSRGMGRAIAQAFAEEGAQLVMMARTESVLQAAAEEIHKTTAVNPLVIPGDVTNPEDIQRLVQTTLDRLGRIDILVCNSGGPPSKPFGEVTDDEWQTYLNLNLLSFIRLARAVIPTMKEQRWGRILNLTSVSVKQPIAGLVLSNVARLGVVGLTKSLANELAPYNILVNNVCPGYVRTDRVIDLAETIAAREKKTPEEVLRSYETDIPLGRMGTPEEIASVFVFLASERASYITGVSLHVDGGFVRGVF
jgi:3-oxoacyl-[acyl-carrier protein] reductase